MRRPLALLAAVCALAAAPARAAEPLDLDLSRLGAPTAGVWTALQPGLSAADAATLAGDAQVRFGRLASDLALAFSSPVQQPGSTTGYAGFAFGLEAGYAQVKHGVVGTSAGGFTAPDYWVTRSMKPGALFLPGFHVRKGLPFSLELGGRLMYLSQSSYYGGQLEAKWALLEGYRSYPDVAVRGAWTTVFGQRDLRLRTLEGDVLVSKRFGVNAVTSFTPYLAARLTQMAASTAEIQFDASAAPTSLATTAAFPKVSALFYRTTAGLRLTSFATFLNAEVTYFAGSTVKASGDRPAFKVPGSFTGAVKVGFEL
jgi:hypothetical protein